MCKGRSLYKDELEKAFYIAKKEFGYIDCLINNASIFEYDNLKTIKSKSGISIFLQI